MFWSEKNSNFLGLPRPYYLLDSKWYTKNKKKYLHKKIPIPYQSKPGLKNSSPISLNIENEKKVVENGLCSYCGIKINDNEESIRWMIEKTVVDLNSNRDLVPSDFHPLHIACMKQARVYCPFMRTLKDEDFCISLNKNNLKVAQENFKKYFMVQWESRER
jgi:hypothetical protein